MPRGRQAPGFRVAASEGRRRDRQPPVPQDDSGVRAGWAEKQRGHPRRLDPPSLHKKTSGVQAQGRRTRPDQGVAVRVPRPMRFFEYEAREIVKRAGIPVTDFGFTKDAAEAKQIAQRIGGPTVIKSQVLTGGPMKAAGGQVAPPPEEAEPHAAG